MANITKKKIDEYQKDPHNANEGTPEGRAFTEGSIRKFGAARSIVSADNGTIIAGNNAFEGAKEAGITDVIEVEVDGTELVVVKRKDWEDENDDEARRYGYADNRASQIGLSWKPEQVDLDARNGVKLDDIFDKETIATLRHRARRRMQKPREVNPEDTPDYTEEYGIGEGNQIWVLGDHLLGVGDCRDAEFLGRLFGERKANLCFTSPPYWVGKGYEEETTENEIKAFIEDCVCAWDTVISHDFGRVIINTGTGAIHRIDNSRPVEVVFLADYWRDALRPYGWLLRHLRLWVKSSELAVASVSPRTDLVADGQFEYLLDFEGSIWEHMLVMYDPSGEYRGQFSVKEPWAQQPMWTDIPGDRSAEGYRHVAAFPVELPSRYIRMYTEPDELVFEPFSGSGTTIIACQILGRACRAVEKDPLYAAMSLKRFEEETGIKPELMQ